MIGLVLAAFLVSLFLGILKGSPSLITRLLVTSPVSLGIYANILSLSYTLVSLVVSFLIFYVLGRKIKLKEDLVKIIVYLIVSLYLGMAAGYSIILLALEGIISITNLTELFLLSINQFFIIFTAIAIAYLKQ
jgi:hypothetical protein